MITITRLCRICHTIFTILICSATLCCSHLVWGQQQAQYQPGSYSVSHFNDQNGLPQNSVKGLAQGADGFVWLTTENGLVRFDGNFFYVFDRSNTRIASNRFQYILPAMKRPFNRLYARQVDEGYLRHQYLRIEHGTAALDSAVFTDIFKAIGSVQGDRDADFPTGVMDLVRPDFRPRDYIIPITGNEGAYFHFRRGKLTYYQDWRVQKAIVINETNSREWFRLGKSLFYRSEDQVLKRLSFADRPDNTGAIIRETRLSGDIENDPLYLSKSEKTKLYWNNTADQVFLSIGNNLYILSDGGDATLRTRLVLSGFDLASNFIGAILYSRASRRLFLGSTIKGLFVVKKNDFRAVSPTAGGVDDIFYAQTGLGASSVQTPNGRLFDLKGEISASPAKKIRAARRGMTEYRIATDRFGNIWTTTGNILYCFAKDGSAIKNKWDLKREISDIYLGHDGTLWIAMAHDLLYRVKYEGEAIRISLWADLRLKEKRINFLLYRRGGHMWVGTGAGVYSLNLKDNKLTLIPGTAAYNVRSLYVSRESAGEHLWITSYNNGFALYRNGALTAFPFDRAGYLAASHYIFEDKNGFFWIPTNKGLFQAKKSELLAYAGEKRAGGAPYYKHFSTDDGFKTNEFNGGCRPCAVRLDNGYVSMPSMNGLLFFIPEALSDDSGTPGIFIDKVESQGKVLPITGDYLTLSQDEKNRNIFVSTPFFGNIENLVLFYALTPKGQGPADQEWVPLHAGEGINVSRLNYGKYTLHVKKRTGFGEKQLVHKSLELNVLPEWYQTWYFRAFMALVGALIVYTTQRMSVWRVQKRNRNLELSVAERTQELRETLHSLRSSEEELTRQLRLHMRMIASISHDVRTPVHYIRVASEGIENYLESDEIPHAQQLASTIGVTSKRLVNLLDSMVAFTKSEMSNTQSVVQETNLRQLVIEKTELFKPILTAQNGRLQIDIPEDLLVMINASLFGVIIHNLIDNAVKVKDGNTIHIGARRLQGALHMIIRDKGPGMPAQLVNWLNLSLTETSRAKPMPDKYDGLGLMIVREIAQILGIEISVQVKDGTTVDLVFVFQGK